MVTANSERFTKEPISFTDTEQLYAILVIAMARVPSIQTVTSTKVTESQENVTSEKKKKEPQLKKGKLRQCGSLSD